MGVELSDHVNMSSCEACSFLPCIIIYDYIGGSFNVLVQSCQHKVVTLNLVNILNELSLRFNQVEVRGFNTIADHFL